MSGPTRRQLMAGATAATVLATVPVAIAGPRPLDPAAWVRRFEAMGYHPLVSIDRLGRIRSLWWAIPEDPIPDSEEDADLDLWHDLRSDPDGISKLTTYCADTGRVCRIG